MKGMCNTFLGVDAICWWRSRRCSNFFEVQIAFGMLSVIERFPVGTHVFDGCSFTIFNEKSVHVWRTDLSWTGWMEWRTDQVRTQVTVRITRDFPNGLLIIYLEQNVFEYEVRGPTNNSISTGPRFTDLKNEAQRIDGGWNGGVPVHRHHLGNAGDRDKC